MPIFQRPYSWTSDEAGQLLDDVVSAFQNSGSAAGDTGYYFLGQLIVSQSNPNAPFEVIDGQQRLITLSTLLAVLRDLLPESGFRDHLRAPRHGGQAFRSMVATRSKAWWPAVPTHGDRVCGQRGVM